MNEKKVDDIVSNLSTEAASFKEEPLQQLPAHIASTRTALAKLIGNTNDALAISAQNRDYAVPLDGQYYIQEIRLTLEGATSSPFEAGWLSLSKNNEVNQTFSAQNNQLVVRVNDLITEFRIKPPKKLFGLTGITIKSVSLLGHALPEFSAKLERLSRIESLRSEMQGIASKLRDTEQTHHQKLQQLSDREKELEKSIEALKQELKSCEEDLEKQEELVSAQKKTLTETIDHKRTLDTSAATVHQDLAEKRAQSSQLASEIASQKTLLSTLKSEANLFPTEIKGFADEGAGAVKQYAWLAAIPLAVISAASLDLYISARSLLTDPPKATMETIYLMAGRLPYVVVTLAIIGAAVKISKILIAEIIGIYRQRLSLTKLSILAKDVSDAAAVSLEVSDEETYETRIYLKMMMLREHLKTYLPADFRYVKRQPPNQEKGDSDSDDDDEEGESSK